MVGKAGEWREKKSNFGRNNVETVNLTRGKVLLCVDMKQNSTF